MAIVEERRVSHEANLPVDADLRDLREIEFLARGRSFPLRQTVRTVGLIYLVAALIITIDLIGWLRLPAAIQRVLADIGVTLLAVGTIHLLDHLSMIREVATRIAKESRELFESSLDHSAKQMIRKVSDSIGEASETIVGDVTTRTQAAFSMSINNATESIVSDVTQRLQAAFFEASKILERQVSAIKVMEDVDLVELFPSRSAAATAICAAMKESSEIWLMGISLNEFCREERGPFLEAWSDLVKGVRAGTKKARILLIDPYCHGAVLRSYSETANTAGVSDRLEWDVRAAARLVHQIRKELGERKADLDVRVYRLPPSMFICRLDNSIFMQTYHFWKARLAGCPIPVLRYRKRENDGQAVCMHSEMGQHFDFVWNHASIRLDDLDEPTNGSTGYPHFLPKPTRGAEWGAHGSGMENVFIDLNRPTIRMQEEIAKAKRSIWIQGVTLKAFFNDSSLARTLGKRMGETGGVDLRIMLLDPDCEQAKFRAYREFRLNNGERLSFDEFTNGCYEKSKLRGDLLETIAKITMTYPQALDKVKKYRTAPHMFLLAGDDAVFVEQYSYGKLGGHMPDEELILGSDMPMLEYQRRIDPVYSRILREIRDEESEASEKLRPQPYPLLRDHFEYAWSQASNVSER